MQFTGSCRRRRGKALCHRKAGTRTGHEADNRLIPAPPGSDWLFWPGWPEPKRNFRRRALASRCAVRSGPRKANMVDPFASDFLALLLSSTNSRPGHVPPSSPDGIGAAANGDSARGSPVRREAPHDPDRAAEVFAAIATFADHSDRAPTPARCGSRSCGPAAWRIPKAVRRHRTASSRLVWVSRTVRRFDEKGNSSRSIREGSQT